MTVGTPKTMVFANSEIPKDAPTSVPLKTEFKSGEPIWMRVFFEKTFGEYMQAESAIQYVINAYEKVDGKWVEIAHSGTTNIDPDMLHWKGFQKPLSTPIMTKLKSLSPGKHLIKLLVIMCIPTPGAKDNILQWQGAYLKTIKLVTTTFGSTAASQEFTFVI